MTNKAAGDIEYGCESCRFSAFREAFFYYFLDWCPKCGVERRFFSMAYYEVAEKRRAEFHKQVREAVRLPEGVKIGRPSRWARIRNWFAQGGNMGLRNDMIRRKP